MVRTRAMCKREAAEPANVSKKIPKVDASSSDISKHVIQTGPLFDSEMYHNLVQILNQLDPLSFTNFARTCKPLYNFCCNARGIQVPVGWKSSPESGFHFHIDLVKNRDGSGARVQLTRNHYTDGRLSRRFSEKELQGLRKMPFVIGIHNVSFSRLSSRQINSEDLEQLRHFLRTFHRIEIREVFPGDIRDWDALAQIVEEFSVMAMQVGGLESEPFPTHLLPIFLKKLEEVRIYHHYVADNLILSAASKSLWLLLARISTETFKILLKKYAACDIYDSHFGYDETINPDDWDRACSEVMPIVHVNDAQTVTKEQGIVYRDTNKPRIFYLLKADGSSGRIIIYPNCITFT